MHSSIRQPFMAFWAFALLAVSMLWGASAYAITAAGTKIKSQATVSYEDGLGKTHSTTSNSSTVTVAEVYAADLLQDQQKDGTVGQTVYFAHQLHNNGNIEDTYTLAVKSAKLAGAKIYEDKNGNGQPDSGEPEITGDFKLAAGATANLVVAANVPLAANKGDKLPLTLTASSKHNAFASSKASSEDNTDTVTVVADQPVLATKKQVLSHTPATLSKPGSVTYRIEITNNGTDMNAGRIYEFFPDFVTLTDKDSITLNKGGDTRLGDPVVEQASTLKAQLPADKTLPENNNERGVYIPLAKPLVSGGTLSVELTVNYTAKKTDGSFRFAAGDTFRNKAIVGYNVPSDATVPAKWSHANESNVASTVLPHLFGAQAKNRDNSSDEEVVASKPAGGVAQFVNTITNQGNGTDTFNLTLEGSTFPAGTTFSLWNETGTVPLSDNNSDGTIDTSVLTAGVSLKIMVKAELPANAEGGPFEVQLKATSAANKTTSDTVTNKLQSITAASIDVANYKATTAEIVFNGEVKAITDFFKADAKTDYDPASQISSIISRAPGVVAEFGLYIANKSGAAESFAISSAIKGGDGDRNWDVTYIHDGIYAKDGSPLVEPTGLPINVTPSLPAESVMKVIAKVKVPADMSQAKAGDYSIVLQATANTSGKNNSTASTITIKETHVLTFGPDGENQVEPGGFALFEHKLANRGNTDLSVTFNSATAPAGWSYQVFKREGEKLSLISKPYGLSQGKEADIVVKVLAPATADDGFVFNLELTADATEVSAQLIDRTTVIRGQIVLKKTVAKVENDGSYGEFRESLAKAVKPGEKVVWKVTATVTGSAKAQNVIITDSAPTYTGLAANKGGIAGKPTITLNGKKIAVNTDLVEASADGKITFYVGSTATKPKGGTLNPGESVEVTFEVMLDK